ncbi:phage tail terminator protein [Arsenophonus sp. PmNCSU2021_1]|uniref:phage tail terminator protein n=1 Tax=Arsenophonus sp. PmNCSU2021_1 TaxID=3118989 RepID=UPI003FA59DE1
MKLSPIIAALRTLCPRFENRVGSVSQYEDLPNCGKLALPAAYVIPGEDVVGEQRSQTDYWQSLTESFYVVVILNNARNQQGHYPSVDTLNEVRSEIWRALLGWQPEPGCGAINYAGAEDADSNRAEYHYLTSFAPIKKRSIFKFNSA